MKRIPIEIDEEAYNSLIKQFPKHNFDCEVCRIICQNVNRCLVKTHLDVVMKALNENYSQSRVTPVLRQI